MADRSLGEELRIVRELKAMTLREVEAVSGVSNAYLSQLETGKITRPSPNVLHKIADVYGIPYELLMERAGYIRPKSASAAQNMGGLAGAALATLGDLTREEADAVAAFLKFLRRQKSPIQE